MARFTIGGAGIAGLTAAINLAQDGHEVIVYEKQPRIGNRPVTYQGISRRTLGIEDAGKYLKDRGIRMTFNHRLFKREELILDNGKTIKVNHTSPPLLIQRGGTGSLEYSLYEQAKKCGVNVKFNKDSRGMRTDIVATGPSRIDCLATGAVYEGANFPDDTFLVLFDDKYSPKGWYLYVIPHRRGRVEIMNCVSTPFCSRVKKLFQKAIAEHPRIRGIIDGAEKIYEVGGRGNFFVPETCMKDGSLYAGEAAGFQDAFMGYGILFAIESGFLAAKALSEHLDYDALWKESLLYKLKISYAKRLFTSLFGSKIVPLLLGSGLSNRTSMKTSTESFLRCHQVIELFSGIQLWRSRRGYR